MSPRLWRLGGLLLLFADFMLSFVVPAYNEELELPSTLASIHEAARAHSGPYEVIVVDDGSTDATAAVAEAGGAKVVNIRRRQIAAARNAGAREARGEVLIFVDADTRIEPIHVSGVMAALAGGCSGGGARVAINEEIPSWGRVFVTVFGKLYFAANLGAGAFLFTKSATFEQVGGFDEACFAGEEIYFTWAVKKIGRFQLLDHPVATSGRKLRMYSGWDVLRRLTALLVRGRRGVQSRENLGLWYDGKRETRAAKSAF